MINIKCFEFYGIVLFNIDKKKESYLINLSGWLVYINKDSFTHKNDRS